jgi:hypothetical protein
MGSDLMSRMKLALVVSQYQHDAGGVARPAADWRGALVHGDFQAVAPAQHDAVGSAGEGLASDHAL